MALTRREFLKSATLGIAGIAAIGAAGEVFAQDDDLMTVDKYDQTWSFMIPPPPITEDQITEVKESEVIVIGAGTAGLCTALSALEAGAKVILFASSATPVARGGSNFAFGSRLRDSLGIPPTKPDMIRNVIATNCFNVDTDKWYKWYHHSEEAMNWMLDHMEKNPALIPALEIAEFDADINDPAYTPIGTHVWVMKEGERYGDDQPYVVEELAKQIEEAGGEIYYRVSAEQLVREDNNTGRVTAVIAKDADGNYIKFVGSKAIVMATGDFSTDREMMKRYAPETYRYIRNWDQELDPDVGKVYNGLYKGQGQKMGLWVGAAWQRAYPNAQMGASFAGPSNMPDKMCGFIVNEYGKRFFAEFINWGYSTNMVRHLPHGKLYQIWDAGWAYTGAPWLTAKNDRYGTETSSETILNGWNASAESGRYFKADTLEELVTAMELPVEGTLAEIERYNGFCEAGEDMDFAKPAKYLYPIKEGPFYGAFSRGSVTIHTVLGGLRTDINMRVCDENDDPIPGLYNVGTMIGDTYAGAYSFQFAGNNLGMNCITFGYLTGKYIAGNE